MVSWNCVVTNCPSGSKVPGHFFPKNINVSEAWRRAINNAVVANLSNEELRKYRVCHLHFDNGAYIFSLNRRKLKHDAVPTLNLSSAQLESSADVECTDSMSVDDPQPSTSAAHKEMSATDIMPSISKSPPHEENKTRAILGDTTRQKDLTPRARRLYQQVLEMKKKEYSVKRSAVSFKKRLRDAKRYANSKYGQLMTSMTDTQQRFIEMQLRNVHTKPRGRRFTLEEKILSLSLFKQSGRCYKLLSSFFILPSSRTLQHLLQKIPIETGVSKIFFKQLAEVGKSLDEKNKLCVLLWDEVALEPHLEYDSYLDRIIGFEDWGSKCTSRIANHALTFMIRGIVKGWKMPVAYHFCKSQTITPQLKKCVKDIVRSVTNSGFHILATVCDQGGSNTSTINELIKETNAIDIDNQHRGNICLDGQYIIPIYDPPHLLKGIRNNLLVKHLEFDVNISKDQRKFAMWSVIDTAYTMDANSTSFGRLIPRITEDHIVLNNRKKMRVKYAAQIFSYSMGSYIDRFANIGPVETHKGPLEIVKKEGHDTAELLFFFNDLFDSVNGHTVRSENELRRAVVDGSKHHSFWYEALKKLSAMRFVDKITKRPLPQVPSLKNWSTTVRGFQNLWTVLRSKNVKCLRARNINQDPLENFFGMIRAHGGRNTNLTCSQFRGTYKTLLLNNLTSRRIVGQNCEAESNNGELLFTFRRFIMAGLERNAQSPTHCEMVQFPESEHFTSPPFENYSVDRPSKSASTSVINKLMLNTRSKDCVQCRECIVQSTKKINASISQAERILNEHVPTASFKPRVRHNLNIVLLENLNLNFFSNCTEHGNHLKDLLLTLIINKFLGLWCIQINQIISGKIRNVLHDNIITRQAERYRKEKRKC